MPAIGYKNGLTFDIYGFSLMAIYKENDTNIVVLILLFSFRSIIISM